MVALRGLPSFWCMATKSKSNARVLHLEISDELDDRLKQLAIERTDELTNEKRPAATGRGDNGKEPKCLETE